MFLIKKFFEQTYMKWWGELLSDVDWEIILEFICIFWYNDSTGGGFMKALITGASSGIGKEIARYLAKLGYDLILVARDREKLEQLQRELPVKVKVVVVDLSIEQKVKELYILTRQEEIDLLVNNAGFGIFGEFQETDISKELEMLRVNVQAVHMLSKFFLKDMMKKDHGMILNIASSASFYAGPLMAAYYSSKSYVYKLSLAIHEELRRKKSHVKIAVVCPGPVHTNFNRVAGVKFGTKALSSRFVAHYAIDQMLKGKTVIIPGFTMKCAKFCSHFVSDQTLAKMAYHFQSAKKQ